MTVISGKKTIFSTSFLVGNDQEAFIDVPLQGDVLKLSFRFESGTAADQRTGKWHHENGVVKFVFAGWTSPLGTCLQEPTKFGDVAGKRMYFQLAANPIGEQNLAHLFISVDE